jgi:hypothetical protein
MNAKIKAVETTANIVEETMPFIIKGIFVIGIALYAIGKFKNRFVSLEEKSNYPKANVSDAQAKAKADAIIEAKSLFGQFEFGSQYNATADALAGLNYNGFVKVYNAFGHQTGVLFSGDLNLIEYIFDQFSQNEIAYLSSLQNGTFF